jgi:large exoprotein involved in heme utilization and adhesion
LIVAVPSEDSNITANAFTGNGGNINITAQGIFGIQRQEQNTPQSDITASSKLGVNGVVNINTLDVDPTQGLATLPAELVEASGLIATGCAALGENEFTVTGRGGLPPSPSDTLSSDTVWTDLRPMTEQAEARPSSEEATHPKNPATEPLVEAQGWVINSKGEVVLTAHAPTVTPHIPWLTPADCHAPEPES